MNLADPLMNSVLEIKAFEEKDDRRVFKGVATTLTPDRTEDVVEPSGGVFKLPMPLLYHHQKDKPIGNITSARVTSKGIEVEGFVQKFDEPPTLKERVDVAWAEMKSGLVRGLSIGFKPLKREFIKETGGTRFLSWEWLELSAVTVPANSEATITHIKQLDYETRRAALGEYVGTRVVSLDSVPGASGKSSTIPRSTDMKTIAEQIAALEAKRAADEARRNDLQNKAVEEGRTKDAAEKQEFDNLTSEIDAIDAELKDLRVMEQQALRQAQTVTKAVAEDPEKASQSRGGNGNGNGNGNGGNGGAYGYGVRVHTNVPKGTAFARYAMALMASKGNLLQAHKMSERWRDTTPEVETFLKAAVDAGTTTDAAWAGPLVFANNMAAEFIELLRPETIVGKIEGLRRVPFNVRMPRQTGGSSVSWVGQGAPKPVSELAFDTVTFPFSKIAGIVVMTQELVRFSNPSAEQTVRQDLIDAIAQYTDEQFLDPTVGAVANVSPASITNGITPRVSTGATVAQITADVSSMLAMYDTGIRQRNPVWIMNPRTARSLALTRTSQDVVAFPGITPNGGTFFGIPVIVSNSVGAAGAGSPGVTETLVVLLEASEIFLADDGQVQLDASDQASLQMNSTPSAGAQQLVSLWQNNMVGLRAERFMHWARRRDAAVAVMSEVAY